jgi:predicted O-methyltransferase YrrM
MVHPRTGRAFLAAGKDDALQREFSINQGVEVQPTHENIPAQDVWSLVENLERATQLIENGQVEKRDLPAVVRLVVEKPVALDAASGHALRLLHRHGWIRSGDTLAEEKVMPRRNKDLLDVRNPRGRFDIHGSKRNISHHTSAPAFSSQIIARDADSTTKPLGRSDHAPTMFTSHEPLSDAPVAVSSESPVASYQDRIARLEHELQTSRTNEEFSRTVLQEVQDELKTAYVRIAQQQEKLKTLVATVRTNRSSQQNGDHLPAAPAITDTELARLDHPYRKLLRQAKPTPASTPARLPIKNTDSAKWVSGLWKNLPAWSKGTISADDAAFLNAVIEQVRPDHVYEIGTAAGASSALILGTMAPYADPFKVWLYSYDITGTCYFDHAHAVGDATREMVPALLEHWKLNLGTALDVTRDHQPNSRPLYFIDAAHVHPWPTLDLIALLPVLKPGDCVVLHDINLPTISAGKFPDHGAQWLLEDWLGPRLLPDLAVPNIGAIIVPEDPRALLASLVNILARPWPQPFATPLHRKHLNACERRLADHLRQHNLPA